MKKYTEEQIRKYISKKYHYMIDWEATMSMICDGDIVLLERGQATTYLSRGLYDRMRNINYYLRKIEQDPDVQW